MEKLVDEILRDLYELDKDLTQYDMHLRQALKKIIEAKPDTQFDEAFKTRLKAELLEKANNLKVAQNPASKFKFNIEHLKNLFSVRYAWAAPILAVCLVAVYFGYDQYKKNGAVYLTKQNVTFALKSTQADTVGVQPGSSFILSASKDLPEKTIEKTISIEPRIDFTVTKQVNKLSLIETSYAAEADQSLPFQYEIKPEHEMEKDRIYKITINNGQIADREYQWAFQIKAPFGVSESLPKNKDTDVEINTGIELKFNRRLPDNYQEFFSITPKAEGTLEKKYDKLYFHPKSLEAKKVYTVTIKKGMVSEEDGESMLNDYSFSFETDKAPNDKFSEFEVENSLTEVNLSINPMIKVNPGDEKSDKYEIEVYKIGGADEFIKSYEASSNADLAWTYYAQNRNLEQFKPSEDKKVFSAKSELIKAQAENNSYFEIPQTLDEGYYFYQLKNGDTKKFGWIASSNLAHYYSLSENNGLFWVYDFAAKNPLVGAQVSMLDAAGNVQTLGKTDESGVLKFEIPQAFRNVQQTKNNFFEIKAQGLKPVAVIANSVNGYNNNYKYWSYLSVDKNKYHPTDTLNFWGILKARAADSRGKEFSAGLYESCPDSPGKTEKKEEPLISTNINISDHDTFTGKLEFAGLIPTSYCLAVIDKEKGEVALEDYISVETYTKPAFQIKVESSKKAVFAGDEMNFHVEADFYNGTPVAGQELKYTTSLGDEGTIRLDNSGEGDLRYTPKYLEKSDYPYSATVEFEPLLAEEGDIWGSAQFELFGPKIQMDAQAQQKADGKYNLNVKLRQIKGLENYQTDNEDSYLGGPVSAKEIEAKIIKITYEKKEDGQYYDYISKTQKTSYTYEQKEDEVDNILGKTDEQGNWETLRNFDLSQDANYRVEFSTFDGQRKKIHEDVYIYTGMDNGKFVQLELNGQVGYYNQNQDYSIDDQVKLKVLTGEEDNSLDGRTLFYRYQNEIDNASVVKGNSFEETFSAKFAPSVSYRAVILTQYGFEETSPVIAKLNEEDRKLNVEIKPTKENYKPGEEGQANITIKDQQGRPVQAEVNVAMVDEALFENSGEDWNGNVLTDLYRTIYADLNTDYTKYALRNQGDGMGGGGDRRDTFLDVVSYVTLQTDSSGQVTTDFKLPDNITGWRITARSYNSDKMLAGQSHTVISSSLPFFAQATLNDTYLTGDNPQLKLRFFGKDYIPSQPVQYSLTSQDLGLSQQAITNERTNYIALGSLPQGEHEIKIEAKQGDKSDTLVRKINVVDSYAQKSESHVYKLSADLTNIQGNKDGYTDLVFTDQGKAKFYPALNASANEQGVRVDQTVASYLAKDLLAKDYLGDFSEGLNLERFVNSQDGDGKGGLQLLTYGSDSLELSAKVADAVPNSLDKKALGDYFTDSIYNQKADIHRIAKALYGLASLDETVLSKINVVKENTNDLTLEDKIYLGLGLAKSGDIEGARAYYEKEIKPQLKIQGSQAWIESGDQSIEKEKLSADLGMLGSYINDHQMSEMIWNYLDTHNPQRDLIVLEKVMIARQEIQRTAVDKGEFTLKTDARNQKISLDQGSKKVNFSQAELKSIRFENIKGDIDVISLTNAPLKQEDIQNDQELSLTRAYNLGERSSDKFAEGDLIKVSIMPKFNAEAAQGGYQVIDNLPSGLKPVTANLSDQLAASYNTDENKDECNMVWYPEGINGNRVTFSLDKEFDKENKCQNLTINYYARVISKGSFKADSAILQSTTDLNRYFALPASQVEIK